MSMRNKLAAAMPFAHLMGLTPAASHAAKGGRAEEDRERDAEDDEDEPKGRKAKGKRAEDERDEKDEARAEDADEEEGGDADEEEDGDEPKGKSRKAKGKRARRAEDDDEDPEAADEDDEAKAVRAAERARCAAIVAHGLQKGCVEQACVFAFDTSLSKTAAINALTAGQAAGGGRKSQSLAERMSSAKVNHVGAEGGGDAPSGMSKTAAAIIRAAEAAGGRR